MNRPLLPKLLQPLFQRVPQRTQMPSVQSLACAIALCVAPACAFAQTYPSRPISLVVGYTPGGSVDLAARSIAPELSKRLGQPITVENVGGAGGQLGTQKVVNAAADGYTLLLGTSAEIAVARHIAPMVKYDGLKDLVPLGLIGTQPIVLVGTAQLAPNNTAELLTMMKARPGKLSYGSAGNGSLPHLAGEYFKQQSGTFAVHIPYRGAAPMITDLLGNQVDLGLLLLSSALPQVKAGKLKAYGVTDLKRAPQLPNVPALAETPGLKDLDLAVFFGVFAPAKTPQPVRDRIAKELAEVLRQPELQARMTEAGFTMRPLDGAGAEKYINAQAATYRKIVEVSKIKEQ
jgi:tripartite-type tricarboxylate transporter receptor subunit TctC